MRLHVFLSTYSNVAGARSTLVNSYREQLVGNQDRRETRGQVGRARCIYSPLERAFLLAAAFLRPPAPDEEKDIGYLTLWNGEKRNSSSRRKGGGNTSSLLEKWEQAVDLRRYGLSTALINIYRRVRFAKTSRDVTRRRADRDEESRRVARRVRVLLEPKRWENIAVS